MAKKVIKKEIVEEVKDVKKSNSKKKTRNSAGGEKLSKSQAKLNVRSLIGKRNQ